MTDIYNMKRQRCPPTTNRYLSLGRREHQTTHFQQIHYELMETIVDTW